MYVTIVYVIHGVTLVTITCVLFKWTYTEGSKVEDTPPIAVEDKSSNVETTVQSKEGGVATAQGDKKEDGGEESESDNDDIL